MRRYGEITEQAGTPMTVTGEAPLSPVVGAGRDSCVVRGGSACAI